MGACSQRCDRWRPLHGWTWRVPGCNREEPTWSKPCCGHLACAVAGLASQTQEQHQAASMGLPSAGIAANSLPWS